MQKLSKTDRENVMRVFRDVFFESPSTNENWQACKENWMTHFAKLEAGLLLNGVRMVKDMP